MTALTRALIAFETEPAARERLARHGYRPDIAAEIAVYLAQATDLPDHMAEIRTALAAEAIAVDFVPLDELAPLLVRLTTPRAQMLLWCLTDGVRFYRGSAVPALARLLGVPRYGAPATAQHLCQDKFLSGAAAQAAGLPALPTLLLEGRETVAGHGALPADGPYFVKPNTLGAKIGIFADSRCATLAEAQALSARIWQRYGDRAVVQPFIAGDDVRVSFMDVGKPFGDQLGIFRLARNPGSEAGGAFMTMKDNETLSGARDTEGTRGGFGSTRIPAFLPAMTDLRRDPQAADAVAAIAAAAETLARLLGLADCFSMDFRIGADGKPRFLEFEVCPAVTIYDFQDYLRCQHGLSLGQALARSFRRAHLRSASRAEA